jgi:sugar lactone lactonase YvrE
MMRKSSIPLSTTLRPAKTMTAVRHVLGFGLAPLALAAACEPRGPALDVTVSPPEGISVQVNVNGPGAFYRTIDSSTTFEGVADGDYSVSAKDRRKRAPHDVVDTIYAARVTGTPATVSAERGARVQVDYVPEPGSGVLWVPSVAKDEILGFSAADLEKAAPSSVTLSTPGGCGPTAVAIDMKGNMWVSCAVSGEVLQLPVDALGGGAPRPARVIRATASPAGLAFGAEGDLFIADRGGRRVLRLGDVITGAPVPKADLVVEGEPRGLAFDGAGHLYVSTATPAAVVIFGAESIASGGAALRGIVQGPATRLVEPGSLAFDMGGDLWVSGGRSGPTVRFGGIELTGVLGAADLVPSGEVGSPEGGSLDGLAFDNRGEAWAVSAKGGRLEHVVSGETGPLLSPRTTPLGDVGERLGMVAFNPAPRLVPIRK